MRLQTGVSREYGRAWIPRIPPVATVEFSTDERRVSERVRRKFFDAAAAGHRLLACFDLSERAAMPMAARGAASSDPSVKMVRLFLHSAIPRFLRKNF